MMPNQDSRIRCLRCSSLRVEASGFDASRHVCSDCGQHYMMVMQMIPVDPPKQDLLLEASIVGPSSRTDGRGDVPNQGS